jgi:hypothetical protein
MTSAHVWRQELPGLALSPGGTRAYVVSRGSRTVVANLTTGRARAIALRADRTLQAGLKRNAGWQRTSRLLGTRVLLSTGSDLSGNDYSGFPAGTAAGLRITDVVTRRTRVAVPGANQFRICGDSVVTARSTAEPGSAAVVGLDRKGRRRWSQYDGKGAVLAGCARGYVYLSIPGEGVSTLDARTGAVLESHTGSAATVIELS